MELKVGMKVRLPHWDTDRHVTITAIGRDCFLSLITETHVEHSYQKVFPWELYEPPKKTVKLAQALLRMRGTDCWELSRYVYADNQEAKQDCGTSDIIWPAIPNKDGFYEVPE